jgi:hypothetical protein
MRSSNGHWITLADARPDPSNCFDPAHDFAQDTLHNAHSRTVMVPAYGTSRDHRRTLALRRKDPLAEDVGPADGGQPLVPGLDEGIGRMPWSTDRQVNPPLCRPFSALRHLPLPLGRRVDGPGDRGGDPFSGASRWPATWAAPPTRWSCPGPHGSRPAADPGAVHRCIDIAPMVLELVGLPEPDEGRRDRPGADGRHQLRPHLRRRERRRAGHRLAVKWIAKPRQIR